MGKENSSDHGSNATTCSRLSPYISSLTASHCSLLSVDAQEGKEPSPVKVTVLSVMTVSNSTATEFP